MSRVIEEQILVYLRERFGIEPKTFQHLTISGNRRIFSVTTPQAGKWNKLKAIKRGMKFLTCYPHLLKLSNAAVQKFGRYARKNTVVLNDVETRKFIQGQSLSKVDCPNLTGDGPVIVFYKNFPIGLAIYRDGLLKSQVPRDRRIKELLLNK